MSNLKKVKKGKSKLDKLKDYLYSTDGKTKLSKTQLASFKRYRNVFAIVSENPRQADVIATVEQNYEVSYRQALRIIKETKALFGDQMKVDLKVAKFNIFQKHLKIAEELYDLSEQCEKAEDAAKVLDKASATYERAAAMYDLKADQEEGKGINAKMFFKQVNVYRTTDPTVALNHKVPKAFRDEEQPTKTIDITPENLSIDDLD